MTDSCLGWISGEKQEKIPKIIQVDEVRIRNSFRKQLYIQNL